MSTQCALEAIDLMDECAQCRMGVCMVQPHLYYMYSCYDTDAKCMAIMKSCQVREFIVVVLQYIQQEGMM